MRRSTYVSRMVLCGGRSGCAATLVIPGHRQLGTGIDGANMRFSDRSNEHTTLTFLRTRVTTFGGNNVLRSLFPSH